MKRRKKLYRRPRKIFEASRIAEEDKLVEKYGLKNKTEIWKTKAKVDYYRQRAKTLAKSSLEEQKVFFSKLNGLGLKIKGTADVLDLRVEDLLERRLSTILTKKKLANTPKHARQMIVHKKVLINGKAMNSPSYLIPAEDESRISIKEKQKSSTDIPKSTETKKTEQ